MWVCKSFFKVFLFGIIFSFQLLPCFPRGKFFLAFLALEQLQNVRQDALGDFFNFVIGQVAVVNCAFAISSSAR